MDLINSLTAYLPGDFDLQAAVRLFLIVTLGSLLLGIIGRVCFGKRSSLNHAVSSAVGILFVYAVTVVIYTFDPAGLSRFLAPLPYVSFDGDYLYLFSFTSASFPAISYQIVNMVILAFLVNLLDSWIPKGKHLVSWYFLRFVTVILAIVLQLIVTGLFTAFLPDILVTYAPIILLGILGFLLLLGVLKVVLGVLLTAVNPLLGAVYTFLFASVIGKMLTKAVLTTVLLTALVYALDYFGYTVFCIASSALAAYLPLVLMVLVLWYLIGHVL